jgi:hypothetical protein
MNRGTKQAERRRYERRRVPLQENGRQCLFQDVDQVAGRHGNGLQKNESIEEKGEG